ncbi:type IV pilin [Halobaculum sp. MBLA0147]|uniref:type IV pilin n=1 Tax=Halobaculum sp. MBLA0147 TaxID=3079934 RepID=UPI003524B88F
MRYKLGSGEQKGVTPVIGVVLLVAVVVVLAGAVGAVTLGQFGSTDLDPAPQVVITPETKNVSNGYPRDDTVILTHEGGDSLRRGELTVHIGPDMVFNRSVNSDTLSGGSLNKKTDGVILEIDDNAWNDLTSPVNEWGETVQTGDTLIIKDRNYSHPNVYDVINEGDRITVVWVDEEDRRFVIFSGTV